jgi:hypothetical protein
MHKVFIPYIDQAHDKVNQLLEMKPVTCTTLPKQMPAAGIYLFSEGNSHWYVGRSNHIKRRLGRHSRPGSTHRMAAFAFLLARKETGNLKATYKAGEGSRNGLMENLIFVDAFSKAKARIRCMDVRFVEETDPTRQALLEIYTAVVLGTPYNDFDTH